MQDLREQIRDLPGSPGVYRYYDKEDKVLYIGKARNLKKRVASYFVSRVDHTGRIKAMVAQIRRIEFTTVATEYDALLLENSLIKQYQPRYNINLKDDKSYPFIVIKKERFPRVFAMRNPVKDGSEYFGPYASVVTMHGVLEFIRKLFPIRSCNFALTDANIKAKKFRVCLDYHIKLCKGPCEALQSEEDYNRQIDNIRDVLKGNLQRPLNYLKNAMQQAVADLQFEEAQAWKEKLELMEKFQARSTIVNPSIDNVDVFSIYSNEECAFVNYLKIVQGTIISTDTVEVKKKLQEEDAEVMMLAIAELRERYKSTAKEIVIPFPLLLKIEGVNLVVPKLGDKKKLLELSRRNAYQYFVNKLKSTELNKDKRKNTELLMQTKNDLGLKHMPYHIECFDNSNLQGTNPISAIVVFKNGVPSKKDYRYFNVRSVDSPNDFATMEEAVSRRYKRLLDEGEPLPQLIIIDGGKGQLSSAMKSLQDLGIADKLDIIGIAKRLEEIYKPGDPLPLSINKKSQSLRLIQRARDEAHRFGLSRHRNKRISTNLHSSLESIPGVGKKTTEKLLSHFKSIKKLKEASAEEIEKIVGKARAKVVVEALAYDAPLAKTQAKNVPPAENS
jgi:excinuclease ABC subunit C